MGVAAAAAAASFAASLLDLGGFDFPGLLATAGVTGGGWLFSSHST